MRCSIFLYTSQSLLYIHTSAFQTLSSNLCVVAIGVSTIMSPIHYCIYTCTNHHYITLLLIPDTQSSNLCVAANGVSTTCLETCSSYLIVTLLYTKFTSTFPSKFFVSSSSISIPPRDCDVSV